MIKKKSNKMSRLKKFMYAFSIFATVFITTSFVCDSFYRKSDNYAKKNSVMLMNDFGRCSGVEIIAPSGKKYIMSAAHCEEISDDGFTILIQDEHKQMHRRRIVAVNHKKDLLLISSIDSLEGIDIAKSYIQDEHVRTFTYGNGLDTYKTEGYLIEILDINVTGGYKFREMVSTAKIVPGSSGGMVVNDQGELVGICSAAGDFFSFFVPLRDIQSFIKKY
jgi:S1-C subfamily serine protease